MRRREGAYRWRGDSMQPPTTAAAAAGGRSRRGGIAAFFFSSVARLCPQTAPVPFPVPIRLLRSISKAHLLLTMPLTTKKTRNLKQNNAKKNRFLVGSDSSDSDDARRVVRSARDRAADQLRATCEEIRVSVTCCFEIPESEVLKRERERRRLKKKKRQLGRSISTSSLARGHHGAPPLSRTRPSENRLVSLPLSRIHN